ncbi:hypothetical protein C8J57DRAFT_1569775 [Mycena rebaudengoi]|nr:hypothetical protein C8J57DRAFT_1569775 [Mycena rebaudengoi]
MSRVIQARGISSGKSAGSWYTKGARPASARWSAFQRSCRAKVTAGTRKIEKKKKCGDSAAGRSGRRRVHAELRGRATARGGGAARRCDGGRVKGLLRSSGAGQPTARALLERAGLKNAAEGLRGRCKRASGAARRRRAGDGERGRGNAEIIEVGAATRGDGKTGSGERQKRSVVGLIAGTPKKRLEKRAERWREPRKFNKKKRGRRVGKGRPPHRAGCAERRRDHKKSKKGGKGVAERHRRVEMERPACWDAKKEACWA